MRKVFRYTSNQGNSSKQSNITYNSSYGQIFALNILPVKL